MKVKRFQTELTPDDMLDITLYFDKNKIFKFAINYRAYIDGTWKEVYRVDNFHGFLHEQRFWVNSKPIPLEIYCSLNDIFNIYIDVITANYQRYRGYMR